MKAACWISILMTLSGCTYNLTNVCTNGKSSDVVDDTTTPTTNVSPKITIPVPVA